MKVWIKLTKHFRGGSHSTYMLVEPNQIDTEEHRMEIMEEWGENSDGGHSYGYSVDMDTLEGDELPPKEWFEKAMKRISDDIGYSEAHIVRQRNLLMEYAVISSKAK